MALLVVGCGDKGVVVEASFTGMKGADGTVGDMVRIEVDIVYLQGSRKG